MKRCIFAILITVSLLISAQALELDFSFGTIGGSGLFSNNKLSGYLEGSLLDFYISTETLNLGLYLSPFNYYITNNAGGLSILNASLFHKTFKPTQRSFLGPFVGIQWIDFADNIPTFKGGIKLSLRDVLTIPYCERKHSYSDSILFHFLDVEVGYIYRTQVSQVFFSIKTDATLLGALILNSLYDEAKEDVKKYAPDYQDRIPKR